MVGTKPTLWPAFDAAARQARYSETLENTGMESRETLLVAEAAADRSGKETRMLASERPEGRLDKVDVERQ